MSDSAVESAPDIGSRLPHGYPFRLLDRVADGSVVVLVAANAAQLRGASELPPMLAVEVMAQAALVVLASAGGEFSDAERAGEAPRVGLLAGIDSAVFHAPLRAGDRVRAQAALLGRMGPIVKVRCELRRDDELVAEAGLLLALQR